MQVETRRGQALSSVSGDEQGGTFGDFLGGDLPKKLALLLVRRLHGCAMVPVGCRGRHVGVQRRWLAVGDHRCNCLPPPPSPRRRAS